MCTTMPPSDRRYRARFRTGAGQSRPSTAHVPVATDIARATCGQPVHGVKSRPPGKTALAKGEIVTSFLLPRRLPQRRLLDFA